MVFRSIKSTLTSMTVIATMAMAMFVLGFAIYEHKNLYKQSVRADLNALTENMSNDLVPILANDADEFELVTLLLRLESYENVVVAAVYDENWNVLQTYLGASSMETQVDPITLLPSDIQSIPLGVTYRESDLVALKRIGEITFTQGYLLIVNDSSTPLNKSTLSLIQTVSPLTIVVLLLIIAMSLWLQNNLLQPLQNLINLTRNIQDTNDYSLRLTEEGKSEVKTLSNEFNEMMEKISEEASKNKQYTLRLKEQRKAMQRLANHDSLTGLVNRYYFMQNLEQEIIEAKSNGADLTLMYIDLDGFKDVNDNHGHEVGDNLLVEVSTRIKSYLRSEDVLARLGGDEFLLLSKSRTTDAQQIELAQHIIKGVSAAFNITGWEIHLSCSLGIAKLSESDYSVAGFVSNADTAMYDAKNKGKGTYSLFKPALRQASLRKLAVARELLPGLNGNEFKVHYQPKVNGNQRIIGYEALLRWNSKKLGFVSPAEFIPVAEQSGKVTQLTQWVITRVFQDIPTLISSSCENVVVSINLSAIDIKTPTLYDFIVNSFNTFKVLPKQVEFEVTESAYLENIDIASEFLNKIRELGVSIALDDFGTGYSSLAYLTQIKLDTIKIDKQFVDNIFQSKQDSLVIKTIIEMGKQMQLNICAEGVETDEQGKLLSEMGCHQLQGYYYGKPNPIEDVSNLEKSDVS